MSLRFINHYFCGYALSSLADIRKSENVVNSQPAQLLSVYWKLSPNLLFTQLSTDRWKEEFPDDTNEWQLQG